MQKNNEKKKKRFNKFNLINCLSFFIVLLLMPIITLFLPKKSFSQSENRQLETLPVFSADNVINRKYMTGLETYISDHFGGRDLWIKSKTTFERALGKYERNNVYILKNRLVEKLKQVDYQSIDKNISAINTFAEKNNTPTFFMLVPTSAEIYSDEIPKNAPNINQRDLINYVYSQMNTNVTNLDVYNNLFAAKDEYIYYRTDHHWTSYGAFLAYTTAGKKMGYTASDINSFDIEHASVDFKGTFNSKTLYDKLEPDIIDIYHYADSAHDNKYYVTTKLDTEPKEYESIYFREFLSEKDKYSVFLGSNQPIVTIKNDNGGDKLLIFKDSFAHCYVPFLTQHYSEITLVDLRYMQVAYNTIINIDEYDQTLILYNVSTFSTDTNPRKLGFTE